MHIRQITSARFTTVMYHIIVACWRLENCLRNVSSNCASFLLDSSPCLEVGSLETQCSKSSKQKWIEGYEAIKTTQQECTNNRMISYDINKPEIEEGKENIDNHFPFDTTVDELEKMIHRPTWLRTLIGHTKTLNHGVPPEISNFPKHNIQMMFLAQK